MNENGSSRSIFVFSFDFQYFFLCDFVAASAIAGLSQRQLLPLSGRQFLQFLESDWTTQAQVQYVAHLLIPT